MSPARIFYLDFSLRPNVYDDKPYGLVIINRSLGFLMCEGEGRQDVITRSKKKNKTRNENTNINEGSRVTQKHEEILTGVAKTKARQMLKEYKQEF